MKKASFSHSQFHILEKTENFIWRKNTLKKGCVEIVDFAQITDVNFSPGMNFANCEETKAFLCKKTKSTTTSDTILTGLDKPGIDPGRVPAKFWVSVSIPGLNRYCRVLSTFVK